MLCSERKGWIEYASQRNHSGAAPAALEGRYRPAAPAFIPQRGTIEYFLAERYCLYAVDGSRQLIQGQIHHRPWLLQQAEAEFARNSMAEPIGIALEPPPLLHFARKQDVLVWPPARVA